MIIKDRANDPKRVVGSFKPPAYGSNEWVESTYGPDVAKDVAKIRADRKANAVPGSPESRGNWTDKSGLR